MMHRTQFEQWIPAALDRVFLFFANPENLPRIMPPETGTELVRVNLVPPTGNPVANNTQLAGVGSEIVTSFRPVSFLPLRAQWIALITEFEWNHHFADIQKKGPFKSFTHHHQLSPETRNLVEGTLIRDVIDYDVGFGPFGELAQKFLISPQLKRTFEYRQKALEKLM
jgi:ligand-binding SRPBCC domain-containing protein